MAAVTVRKPQGSVRRVRSAERQDVDGVVDPETARQAVARLAELVAGDASTSSPPSR